MEWKPIWLRPPPLKGEEHWRSSQKEKRGEEVLFF
jgi:hypothetical protein